MSGRFRARRGAAAVLASAIVAGGVLTVANGVNPAVALATAPTIAARINLTQQDLEFILAQIQIAEAHPDGTGTLCTDPNAAIDPTLCNNTIPNKVLPFGLRQTNGENNNITPGNDAFGAADRVFPRLTAPQWSTADDLFFDPDGPGPLSVGSSTTYAQNGGIVVDADPRLISNLISDVTERNPAAAAAAADTPGHGFGATTVMVDHDRNPATPDIVQYVIPNVAPDAGFTASYNSLFTLFGQFFDHGLDLAKKGGSGTVFVPLQPDDPLYVEGSPNNFMVLTRATNQPGDDGVLGTADDVKDATNLVTPYIDNNQTYTSHPSHQVFLREYRLDALNRPVDTGRLLDGADGGLATWDDVQRQAEQLLGIALSDFDVTNVPLLATDAYGNFLPGLDGHPMLVLANGSTIEGNPAAPVSAAAVGAVRTGHAFLDDIAHHAAPGTWDHDGNPGTPKVAQIADLDSDQTVDDGQPGTYDDEMLGAHFICGDGRCNENIGLTSIHHVFHEEHNGLVDQLQALIPTLPEASPAALAAWLLPDGSWNGTRLFQAAKFVNEMEYQHVAFEEFARTVSPSIGLFDTYNPSVDPAISAEFAHAVYRFGHSMLTETVARTNADGSTNDIALMDAFLDPIEFNNGGSAGHLDADHGAGAVIRGMVNQRGDEIDEFVTEALRNNLVGLPLDLASLNITRARSEGMAPLNQTRRDLFEGSLQGAGNNTALKPYHDWNDFGLALRNRASLVNFVAAYGLHPTIIGATTIDDKRAAAAALVEGTGPADAGDFMDGAGDWTNVDGRAVTGLEDVDLWIGGLAEAPPVFGGLLGSTFNFVFEHQMEALQDNDRMYYLLRNEGLPLLSELEATTFSDLVRRNTDATNVPVLAFTAPDWTFDLTAQTNPSGIVDDPATPYNEANLDGTSRLVRMSDGTIRLTGSGTTENHSTWLGTNGNDRVRSAEGDDSLWGNDGDDRLEGGIGADHIDGGYGDDILTDSIGDDVIDGGPGHDVIHGGSGLDILFGMTGDDAIFHGADDKESFSGSGDDIVVGGAGLDAVSGGPGEDWVEGGFGGDGLTGDERADFVLIPGEDDVLLGQGGDDLYLSEGGMDIAMMGDGIDTNKGGLGFDFASYARSTTAAFGDLSLPPIVGGPVVNPRDRFALVEGVSGGAFDDTLRGDDRLRPAGHELTQENLDKVAGLADLLLRAGLLSPQGSLNMFQGDDIVIGGGGSDMLEGGGGADLIDGDAFLDVALVCTRNDGTVVTVATAAALQSQFLAGAISPAACDIQRGVYYPDDVSADVDTAVYRFPQDEYVVGQLPDGTTIVSHIPVNGGGGGGGGGGGATDEGTDILLGVEQIQFSDGLLSLAPGGINNSPEGTVSLSTLTPAVGDFVDAIPLVVDADGIDFSTEQYLWQSWDGVTVDPFFGDPTWVDLAPIGPSGSYEVLPEDVGKQIRVFYMYTDLLGMQEAVLSETTAPVVTGVAAAPATLTLTVPSSLADPTVLDTPNITLSATFLDAGGLPIVGADVTFVQGGVALGAAPTGPDGTATLDVILTDPSGTVVDFAATAVDPAPLDVAFTDVSSFTEVRLTSYPTASMTFADSIAEDAAGVVTPLTATISLDSPAANDVTVDWAATVNPDAPNAATDGADFVAATGSVVVPAGEVSTPIAIDVLGDDLVEGDEVFDVAVTAAVGALVDPVALQATIVDDDVPTLILGADPSATESLDGGSNVLVFDVSLDQVPTGNVSADYVLVSGTAAAGVDYLDDAGVVVFAPGQQTAQVIVTINDDTEVEFDETLVLSLSNVVGANAGALESTGTIIDDDVVTVTAGSNLQVIEGNQNARNRLNFTVHLDAPSVHPVDVTWTAGGGTAAAGSDFTGTGGTVQIPAGATSATVPVIVLGDTRVEPNETVNFRITGAVNASLGTRTAAVGTIVDDDTPPAARISDVTLTEGNSGTKAFTFTITLSRAPTAPVSVVAATANGTARSPGDYRAVSTTVNFPTGQTTRTVTVLVVGDRTREATETFQVRLSRASGMTITDGTGVGTIVNDD